MNECNFNYMFNETKQQKKTQCLLLLHITELF